MTAEERTLAVIEHRDFSVDTAAMIVLAIRDAEQEATAPLRARIAELEAKLQAIEALLDRWAEEG